MHNRRQIIARLHTLEAAHKLVDDITPKLSGRSSGHLRVERTSTRRGDNAQLARVSFVDDLKKKPVKKAEAPTVVSKPKAKKSAKVKK